MASSTTRPYWKRIDQGARRSQDDDLGWPLVLVLGLVCGGVAALVFDEAALMALRHYVADVPVLATLFGPDPSPYRLETRATGLPAAFTQVTLGAFWGVPLAAFLCRGRRMPMLATGAAFGAIGVGGMLLVCVPALRGWPIIGFGYRETIWLTLLLSAGWGWGTALLLKATTHR